MKIIDKDIAQKIATANGLTVAKLGLRFDKVAVRLLANTRASVSSCVPQGTAVLLTITAPIKLPSKTELELCKQIKDVLNAKVENTNQVATVFENKILFRMVSVAAGTTEKFIGFVHNPESDPGRLIDLAAHWLVENPGYSV